MAASPRRRIAATAATLLVTGVLIGCGNDRDDPPDSPASPTLTTPAMPGVELAAPEPDFPDTVQDYAELTVAAWAAPDLFRLAELATPAVQTELIELPGPPNRNWSSVECRPAGAASECSFRNAEGDELVLTVNDALLGGSGATTGVAYDPTRYPADPQDYVAELLDAWQAGNLARMNRLAAPGAVATFQELPLPDPGELDQRLGEPTPVAATVLVTVAGTELTLLVGTALLGEPQAIRAARP